MTDNKALNEQIERERSSVSSSAAVVSVPKLELLSLICMAAVSLTTETFLEQNKNLRETLSEDMCNRIRGISEALKLFAH